MKWQTKKLGDICDFEGGSQPAKSEFIYAAKAGYVRFLQIRDFGSDKHITYIPHSKKNRLCTENDILIGRYGASVGKILTGRAGAYNVALVKTIPDLEVLTPSWFYNYLVSDEFQGPLLNVAARSAQAGFSKEEIYNFTVPVPPLPEQQRIVSILDEAFAGIATAKANAAKNLSNARALFVSHQWSTFDRLKAPLAKIAEFASVFDGPHATPKTVSDGPIFLGISTLRDGRLLMRETRHVTPEDFKKWTRRVIPREGDVVFSYETQLGQAALIPKNLECCLGRRMALVRVDRKKVDPRYFVYHFVSPQFRHFLNDHAIRGATVDRISLREFPAYSIPLPNLTEQMRVADQLDELRQRTDQLESLARRKMEVLDALKKSLLHQAFSGQLTAGDKVTQRVGRGDACRV